MNRLKPERRQQVEERLLAGESQREISVAVGCAPGSVVSIRRDMERKGIVLPTVPRGVHSHKDGACVHHWRIDGGEACRCEGEAHRHAVCAQCGAARTFPAEPDIIGPPSRKEVAAAKAAATLAPPITRLPENVAPPVAPAVAELPEKLPRGQRRPRDPDAWKAKAGKFYLETLAIEDNVVLIRQRIVDVARVLHERVEMLKKDQNLFDALLIAAMALDIPTSELPYDDYRSMVADATGDET